MGHDTCFFSCFHECIKACLWDKTHESLSARHSLTDRWHLIRLILSCYLFLEIINCLWNFLTVSLLSYVFVFRLVCSGGRRQRGEPEAKVGKPGSGSVHRKPHVSLQRVPDHWHQEQTKVRTWWSSNLSPEQPGSLNTHHSLRHASECVHTSTCHVLNVFPCYMYPVTT